MYPILFHFGLFEVSAFGVCMAMGFLVASFVIWRPARDAGLEEGKIVFVLSTLQKKLPVKIMVDAYGSALGWMMFFASLAVFLDGTVVGRQTRLFSGMMAVGAAGLRH